LARTVLARHGRWCDGGRVANVIHPGNFRGECPVIGHERDHHLLEHSPDYSLRIAPLRLELAPGKVIDTFAYNGTVPGPVLRLREGRQVNIDIRNDVLGAGRFAKIGIPFPDVMGPFVGMVEIVCGSLVILGIFTRLAVIPLIIIMIVALISTKLPILLGHEVWMFHLAQDIKRTGFWSMMHEARADLTM
jgi:DoxX/Multicopper oxidase